MVTFHPFKGIRATQDKMHLVASRSFLSYNEKELKEKLTGNPFTFLHVIHPTQKRDVEEKIKFEEVRSIFDGFVQEGIFIQEQTPAFYLYRQLKDGKSYLGWMGGIAVDDYRNGKVKVHEHTIERRENLFADYLAVTGINAEPVLMFSRFSNEFKQWTAQIQERDALSDFTTTDKARHTIWVVQSEEDVDRIQGEFSRLNEVYIADGHHRSASSERLQRNHPEWEEARYFLSYIIDEDDLTIHPFHRMIADIDLREEEILSFLNSKFQPVVESEIPTSGQFVCLTQNQRSVWSFLPDDKIDPDRIAEQVITPLTGIVDFRKDKRIRYSEGPKGEQFIQSAIASGKINCAFLLSSVTTEELCHIADGGGVMPPKSTYIEPKLRSGLIIYPISYGI
ncbi:MAG: hypothetical protein RL062_1241 [Bacteroidota bacterium]|jgi:uncharacterized protein (DUF1015 family)